MHGMHRTKPDSVLERTLLASRRALRHAHTKQDEFVYILEGHPVLITDQGETPLSPGMCAGFKAGTGNARQLVNRTNADVLYLEVGDRSLSARSIVHPKTSTS